MDLKLKDKIAIVTGAGSGMGKETALVLADEGCDVAVVDLNLDRVKQTAEAIEAKGRRSLALQVDVADSENVKQACSQAIATFGKVELLCNIAGHGAFSEIEQCDNATWDRMMAVHMSGAFYFIRELVPGMKERRYGKIANMASMYGMVGEPLWSCYSAAKAGIIGFTKALAKELAPFNITVNAVAPGKVATELALNDPSAPYEEAVKKIPLGQFVPPDEIACLFAYLCSDRTSGTMTGQVISHNGGQAIVGI